MTGTDIANQGRAVARHFDAQAEAYGSGAEQNPAARLKHELLRRYVRSGDSVLDVGCANGIHIRTVAPLCREVHGVDVSDRMLKEGERLLAQARIRNAVLARASATDLPYEPARFDLVYSFSTLIVVANVRAAVAEIARVVRPGGLAILDLTGRWNLQQRHWRRWYRQQGIDDWSPLSLREVRRLLAERALHIVELHGLGACDQWKYARFLNHATALERIFHAGGDRDLDYRLSSAPGLRGLANRWYVVARK
jgi:ubiquinone/menaquinone biosynthesis C-methylase UbiE